MAVDFAQWMRSYSRRVILRVVSGSRAYGLATEHSDADERGVFVVPAADWLSLSAPVEHVQDERGDNVLYGLRKFLALAAAANPSVLEVLFAPADTILARRPAAAPLLAARSQFVTAQCVESHIGYARTQIHRARGQNKWIHHPQPEAPPRREDFCYVVRAPWPGAAADGAMPLRPAPLAQSGVDLREHHCAALEHAPRTYRLYHYGPGARGVFREGVLVCESVPREDEFTRLRGLLIYDEEGYARAKRDHEHYWQWRVLRNDARWRTQEAGEIDYDAKNLMHTFRLLMSTESILLHGAPRVRFEGRERDELLRIRSGAYSYEELVARADERIAALESLRSAASLPAASAPAFVDELLRTITERWESERE
jgi:predicted nucleotidyltransferase